jgi:transcription termination/antitermination protein NusG
MINSTSSATAAPAWCALWTHVHCEQLVHDQLVAKGFETFLPLVSVWSRRGGARHLIQVPLFSGYLFLRRAIDKASYIEIMKTRGLTRILGDRWDLPAIIDDDEIDTIRKVVEADLPVMEHSYLQEGQRVRITEGPLADVEGLFLQAKPAKGLLIVSVNLLQRSVAVEVDCTAVVPTGGGTWRHTAACALAH